MESVGDTVLLTLERADNHNAPFLCSAVYAKLFAEPDMLCVEC